MKRASGISAEMLIGGIFAFIGATFAAIGILFFIFGDPHSVSGSFDDPKKNFIFLCGMFTFMGLIFFVVGMAFLIRMIKAGMKAKKLVQNGSRIYAKITGVCADTSIVINGRNPFYAICEYEDPYTLEKKTFKSKSFDTDLNRAIGTTVTVYVDQTNRDLYYVDLDPDSIPAKY
jgi:hypothetical protein